MTAALQALTKEAAALGLGRLTSAATEEVARQLQICNACRYCESFCAVFPAMTRRLEFSETDAHYLANLCHNCGACLHACQYAPPHEFAVNIPQAMAVVRKQTYSSYAWPAPLGALYRRNGTVVALVLAAMCSLFLMLGALSANGLGQAIVGGNFYRIFPHNWMVAMFAPVFIFVLCALGMGVQKFWRTVTPGKTMPGAKAQTLHDAAKLKYLDGGHGEGCHNENDAWTHWRRRFHHLAFYGFLLCFAATSTATIYHYVFGWVAPYGWLSLPKLLGTLGGIGLIIGPVGLFAMKKKRHPEHGDATQNGMDYGFICLLFLLGVTGLAIPLLRTTAAMPTLLCIHLGVVMAFFLTMPYSKFAHGFYRLAAMLKYAIEQRLPSNLRLGAD